MNMEVGYINGHAELFTPIFRWKFQMDKSMGYSNIYPHFQVLLGSVPDAPTWNSWLQHAYGPHILAAWATMSMASTVHSSITMNKR
jgi:hypothetical protein